MTVGVGSDTTPQGEVEVDGSERELAGATPPPGPSALILATTTLRPRSRRGRLTGIVDWTSASVGPIAFHVGHVRWPLAADYGLDTPKRSPPPPNGSRGTARGPAGLGSGHS